MDYGKIVKQSFAWYNSIEFWKWNLIGLAAFVAATLAIALAVLATMGGAIASILSGNYYQAMALAASGIVALILGIAIWFVLILILDLFISAKILKIALAQGGYPSNNISAMGLLRFFWLGIANWFYQTFSVKKLILLPLVLIGWAARIAGAVFDELAVLDLLYLVTAFPVAVYNAIRLMFAPLFFWKKENCGVVESIDLSWNLTQGRAIELLVAIILLGILEIIGVGGLIIVGIIGIVIGMSLIKTSLIMAILIFLVFVSVCGLAFLGLSSGTSTYFLVAAYSEISGEGKGVKAPEAKKASAPVKKAVAKKK